MSLVKYLLLLCASLALHPVHGILHGQKIGISELPFVVLGQCRKSSASKTLLKFTGMIIDERHILTHCEYCESQNYTEHQIQAGRSYAALEGGFGVAQFHLHPQRVGLSRCFCVMRLDSDLQWGPQVQKTPFIAARQVFPSRTKQWLVAGWGRTEKNTASRELRSTLARPVADCESFYPAAAQDKTLFCLGMAENEKTSFGDQGGPVYNLEENVVYGMIINGETDTQEVENDPQKPMLMAQVSTAREWIDGIRNSQTKRGEWNL